MWRQSCDRPKGHQRSVHCSVSATSSRCISDKSDAIQSGRYDRCGILYLFGGRVFMATSIETWQHRAIITNGIRMHYVTQGEGPLIVLLHGFPERSEERRVGKACES